MPARRELAATADGCPADAVLTAESYILGHLAGSARAAFEGRYLTCTYCAELGGNGALRGRDANRVAAGARKRATAVVVVCREDGFGHIFLVAGTGACDAPAPPQCLPFLLTRPTDQYCDSSEHGRTIFASTWTISWSSFPLRLEGPAANRAFLNEASKEESALPTSRKETR